MTSEPTPSITLPAFGKVNLGLRVAARRGDGFHELDTLFATISLHDDIQVRFTGEGVHGTTRDDREGRQGEAAPAMDESNLVWRAANAWLGAAQAHEEATGTPAPRGIELSLIKRLPVAAGLGGGSSDAGATLRALATLAPGRADLPVIAASLGSDVPFFAAGYAAARGRGRGERLTELELDSRSIVLYNPGVSVPVREAYQALGGFGPPIDWDELLRAWQAGETVRLRNDLQPGVSGAFTEVRAALATLRASGLSSALLSGSGATCFGVAENDQQARQVAEEISRTHPDAWVQVATVPATGTTKSPARPQNQAQSTP